jgi:hypothetical protein
METQSDQPHRGESGFGICGPNGGLPTFASGVVCAGSGGLPSWKSLREIGPKAAQFSPVSFGFAQAGCSEN